jgi:hypothetical protein
VAILHRAIEKSIWQEQDYVLAEHNRCDTSACQPLLERPTFEQTFPDSILYVAAHSTPAAFFYKFKILDRRPVIARMCPLKQHTRKRVRIMDTLEARVELINGTFPLPPEVKTAMSDIREAVEQAARCIHAAAKRLPQKDPHLYGYDVGRLIAAMDALQHAKDIACVAVILPYAEKDA